MQFSLIRWCESFARLSLREVAHILSDNLKLWLALMFIGIGVSIVVMQSHKEKFLYRTLLSAPSYTHISENSFKVMPFYQAYNFDDILSTMSSTKVLIDNKEYHLKSLIPAQFFKKNRFKIEVSFLSSLPEKRAIHVMQHYLFLLHKKIKSDSVVVNWRNVEAYRVKMHSLLLSQLKNRLQVLNNIFKNALKEAPSISAKGQGAVSIGLIGDTILHYDEAILKAELSLANIKKESQSFAFLNSDKKIKLEPIKIKGLTKYILLLVGCVISLFISSAIVILLSTFRAIKRGLHEATPG